MCLYLVKLCLVTPSLYFATLYLLSSHGSGHCVLDVECEYVFAAFSSSVIVLHVPTHLGSACINASTHAALLCKCNKGETSLEAVCFPVLQQGQTQLQAFDDLSCRKESIRAAVVHWRFDEGFVCLFRELFGMVLKALMTVS